MTEERMADISEMLITESGGAAEVYAVARELLSELAQGQRENKRIRQVMEGFMDIAAQAIQRTSVDDVMQLIREAQRR